MEDGKKLNPSEELLIVELDDRYEFSVFDSGVLTNDQCMNENDCTNTSNGLCKNTGACFY